MDPLIIAGIMILLLVATVLLGVYVGISLAFLSVIGLWMITGNFDIAAKLLGTTSYSVLLDYVFGVLPFFVAMGLLANVSGASTDLYTAFNLVTRNIRGGLGMATVFSNAVFAAITGVSIASAAVFSKISLPQMLARGYNRKFALGVVAGSSVLGMLIPPSVLLVIYGVLSEEAIGRLFIAGIIPGVILTVIYALGIGFMAYRRPQLILTPDAVSENEVSRPGIGFFQFLKSFSSCWGVVVLIGVTLGGIWLGFFTPTEAGAVGAFGALILGLVKRRLNVSKLWSVLLETGITVASIFFLLIAGQMYSRMLALSGIINWLSGFVTSLALPPIVVILLLLLLLFILGAILDSTSIMLMTLPLMLPIVESLGYDLIWFGIVFVVVVEMGLLTPPFGMVVFAMKAALGEEAQIDEIFRGSYPFLFMMAIFVVIIIAFPILITWLPSLM